MRYTKEELLTLVRDGSPLTRGQKVTLTILLSLPAILAQLTSTIMQYIDASMVGSLGAAASASIGLVSTTIWLFGGLCTAAATGFAVQVAHKIGAKDNDSARQVLREGITSIIIFGLGLLTIGCLIAPALPRWLGGSTEITSDASIYFAIYALMLPVLAMNSLASSMLRCSGNIIVPSVLSATMCVLDVIFNYLLIFPTHIVNIFGFDLSIWGANLKVTGAALGTALAVIVTCCMMVFYLVRHCPSLCLREHIGSFRPTKVCLQEAFRIGGPMGSERALFCGAQILTTIIVAPLGTFAIAANSFAITAESLCYMPGFGIGEAATTLIGQSMGAKRRDLCHSFSRITVALGITVMSLTGIIMYMSAPLMMSMLSPVTEVQLLGTEALRIEAWTEPLYGASIVAYGVFVGAGDTFIPCCMNLFSIWAVRLTLAAILAPMYGLAGVWIAMAIELSFRGIIFLIRLRWGNWLKIKQNNNK